jgi:hypothetical protein
MSDRSPMNLLEDALIDVETSTGALDDVLAHLDAEVDPDARERCISALTRLILADVAATRAAYDVAWRAKRDRPSRPPKGGGGGLTVVKGGAA